jgi:hypothetical protein
MVCTVDAFGKGNIEHEVKKKREEVWLALYRSPYSFPRLCPKSIPVAFIAVVVHLRSYRA